jgi:phosphosulfolactate synthase
MTIEIPLRTEKNRKTGITSIHDVGIPLVELNGILESYSSLLDFTKIGVGSAYVEPKLENKIALYKKFDVKVYFGGTLFEKFYYQGKYDEYLDFLISNNINIIEISSGVTEISVEDRVKASIKAKNKGFTVLNEVGSKDGTLVFPPSQWLYEINTFLDSGSDYIIMEGRDNSNAGLFRPNHEIRDGLFTDIVSSIDPDCLIFEAGTHRSQMYFINRLGANVNLGNIKPRDLLLLETQRLSLRNETFFNKN